MNLITKFYNKTTLKKQKSSVGLYFPTRESENTVIKINIFLIICKFIFMVDWSYWQVVSWRPGVNFSKKSTYFSLKSIYLLNGDILSNGS